MQGSLEGFQVKGLTESATGKNHTQDTHTRGSDVKIVKRCKDARKKGTGTSPYENSRTMQVKRIEGAPAWGKKERRRVAKVAGERRVI